MSSGRSSGALASPMTRRIGDAEAVGQRRIEPRAVGRRFHDVRIDVPVLRLVERAGPMRAQGRGEILAEAPSVRRAVVVDHADLVVTEAVDAVLVEKELRVLNEEVAHLGFPEVEHQPARVSLVGEVQRIAVPGVGRLPIEEVQAFVAEVAAGVVVDEIEHDGEPMKVRQIDERLQLVHLAAQILDSIARHSSGVEQLVDRLGIWRERRILDGEVHLRREVVGAVVSEAELRLKLLDRHQLKRRHAKTRQIWESCVATSRNVRLLPADSA